MPTSQVDTAEPVQPGTAAAPTDDATISAGATTTTHEVAPPRANARPTPTAPDGAAGARTDAREQRAPAGDEGTDDSPIGPTLATAQLSVELSSILPDEPGAYGIVIEDVASSARFAHNATQVFPSASLYKLGVAWAVLRTVDAGALGLDTPIEIEDDDAVEVEPIGGVAPGETPTVDEALAAMLTVSSNAAAHAFMRLLGRQAINRELVRIGLDQTRIPESDDEAGEVAGTAVTDASDMAHLLRLIATSPELSDSSREELVRLMSKSATPDALRDNRPAGVDIFDKTGNLDDSSNVAALLQSSRGMVLLAVVDQGVDPGDARTVIARLGQYAYVLLAD